MSAPEPRPQQRMRIVAVEEHFWTAELAEVAGMTLVSPPGGRDDQLLRDVGAARLADMDAAGIDMQVLSHAAPAAQHLPAEQGRALAKQANDQLATAVRAHPDRFAGFATLPTQDPGASADELERCVNELGFVGAMVNSTFGTDGRFLDDSSFEPLLARVERLGVPLYLHPSPPPAHVRQTFTDGLTPEVGWLLSTSAWGFHAEAGLHVLRMVLSGVFDRHPELRVVIGHGGEMLPFMLDRIDRILSPAVTGLSRPVSSYLLSNVWITTSGIFSVPPLMCALQVFGVDRVMFSVDYPYSPNRAGQAVLEALPVSEADRQRIGAGTADDLFGLRTGGVAT